VTTYLAGTTREHVIDTETLREVPTRPAELAAWVARMCQADMPADPVAERLHRTELGVAARLAGELGIAERELRRAAELAAAESPAVALRARLRLAQVHQWQGRFTKAAAEFAECGTAAATPADRALTHQHAGRCAYDAGDFDQAAGHFQAALRLWLASGAEPSQAESSRVALDAADACRTAIVVAAELDRLVPGGHRRIRDELWAGDPPGRDGWGNALSSRPPHLGVLLELRGPLRSGPVPLDVVAGLFRYYAQHIEAAVDELVAAGWLLRSANAVAATPNTMAVLDTHLAAAERALDLAWGWPADLLARLVTVVDGAVGTSAGPVFDTLATVDPPSTAAVRLFERCNALRHHRADAHAAAWRTVGLTATSVAEVPATDPVRLAVETATNRIASRAFRPLSTVERAELGALLRQLPV
jgi:tetratricopeptide (TPR) repeat protein